MVNGFSFVVDVGWLLWTGFCGYVGWMLWPGFCGV